MMAQIKKKKLFIRSSGPELLMFVSQLIGVQRVVLFFPSIPVVLFDNPGITSCLNTLFLLISNLCFIIGFTCD